LMSELSSRRQQHGEDTALAGSALDHQSAAMAANNMLYDGKAEASPALVARSSCVHPVEALCQARQKFRSNSVPLVAHRNGHRISSNSWSIVAQRERDGDLRFRRAIFHSVLDQIVE